MGLYYVNVKWQRVEAGLVYMWHEIDVLSPKIFLAQHTMQNAGILHSRDFIYN